MVNALENGPGTRGLQILAVIHCRVLKKGAVQLFYLTLGWALFTGNSTCFLGANVRLKKV